MSLWNVIKEKMMEHPTQRIGEGDACMTLPGIPGKMGATSSIVGTFMAQSLGLLLARELQRRNMEVPVFLSANVDAGDAWNEKIMKQYYGI